MNECMDECMYIYFVWMDKLLIVNDISYNLLLKSSIIFFENLIILFNLSQLVMFFAVLYSFFRI